MYRAFLFLLLLCPLRSEIVDRVAITVGRQVITEIQIDEELRVTAFQNHAPISRSAEIRRAAANRIVAQILVEREMQFSHYPGPEAADVDRYLQQIRGTFVSNTVYEQALREYRLTEPILKQHLTTQLATLSFIELRFRPNLDVSDSEREERTDQILDTWLVEARKRVTILYLDKALQ